MQEPSSSTSKFDDVPDELGLDPMVCADECAVRFRIEIVPNDGCLLAEADERVDVIQHNFDEDECDVVIRRADGTDRQLYHGSTSDIAACPLVVMRDYDVSPAVHSVTAEGFVVDGFVSDEERVWPLIDELRALFDSVTVRHVIHQDELGQSPTIDTVDLAELTEKQRRVLETAYREGYFERPRETSQAALAKRFDVSKQAVSRLLARAERTILDQLSLD
ncbi:Transcriptional regulator, contains HTH domain [Halanaeroarchaeum sp. HSR-CO]|uniref:helix-turn-helix domain-containing protein n=1 Tax=Halanaeroarchaeum sp. HSR-CO TaxID=2866382 RepID=UPI00217F0FA7|nr:helix-turn-helix domain-containing protein [Halanaeroarchaeum sp. HSR-CO]UWG49078.1 Transcriptional regulator, contains HTH domain [Halanaeroarchaeum sp. HSR-CO]